MSTWTAPADNTYHFQADRSPHGFEFCTEDCRIRGGVLPWIAKGTVVDPERIVATADEKPPRRLAP